MLYPAVGRQCRSACRWLLLVTLAGALLACGVDSPESRLDNYLTRLSRVLEQTIVADNVPVPSLSFPRPRELKDEPRELAIGLIDFLSLKGCKVQKVVASTNDSLGRVAQPSTRLVLHLDFLQLAPECVTYLVSEGKAQLAKTLQQAYHSKVERLPRVIWNAILGGEEYRAFWRAPNTLSEYPAQEFTEADQALVALTEMSSRWLAGDYEVHAAMLESVLQRLSSGDGGHLLKSLTLQQQALSSANPALQKRVSEQPLCYHAAAAKGQILDNVVRKFFVADVQAWSARLESRRFKLLPKVKALEKELSVAEPYPFRAWREQRNEMIAHYALAPKRHAQALLPLLKQCGRAPGSPT